jgi:YHS domain-containing protein
VKKTAWFPGFALLLVLLGATAVLPQPPTTSGGSGVALLNLNNTVAVKGYDVVAYFTENRAVPGRPHIKERLGMATYYFASARNRYLFLSNAPQYQPQFGGYDAMAMARGRLEDVNPHVFAIYQGKLYLFRDPASRAAFFQNPDFYINEATANYFEIAKERRSY